LLSHLTTRHAQKKHAVSVVATFAEKEHNGRLYKLLLVRTQDGLEYVCLRLYNAERHFIKQFLFETELVSWLKETLANCGTKAKVEP